MVAHRGPAGLLGSGHAVEVDDSLAQVGHGPRFAGLAVARAAFVVCKRGELEELAAGAHGAHELAPGQRRRGRRGRRLVERHAARGLAGAEALALELAHAAGHHNVRRAAPQRLLLRRVAGPAARVQRDGDLEGGLVRLNPPAHRPHVAQCRRVGPLAGQARRVRVQVNQREGAARQQRGQREREIARAGAEVDYSHAASRALGHELNQRGEHRPDRLDLPALPLAARRAQPPAAEWIDAGWEGIPVHPWRPAAVAAEARRREGQQRAQPLGHGGTASGAREALPIALPLLVLA